MIDNFFNAFCPSYKEYVISCKEEEEIPIIENQFNSLKKNILHCVLKKINTHMKEIFDFDVHTKGCTICKWIAEELPKLSEEDLKKKREKATETNEFYANVYRSKS